MFQEMLAMNSSSGGGGLYLEVVPTSTLAEIVDAGFVPKHVLVYLDYSSSSPFVMDYDVDNNHVYASFASGGSIYYRRQRDDYINNFIKVEGTKVYLKQSSTIPNATNYVFIV